MNSFVCITSYNQKLLASRFLLGTTDHNTHPSSKTLFLTILFTQEEHQLTFFYSTKHCKLFPSPLKHPPHKCFTHTCNPYYRGI